MAEAQTPVTVGAVTLTLPANWDTLMHTSPTQVVVDYSIGGQNLGTGLLFENGDSSNAASMGRIFAQAMAGNDKMYVAEGDSSKVAGAGMLSWAQFGYIDTSVTPNDTAHGRYYFASNGSNGVAIIVLTDSVNFAPAMYNDITTMLMNWALTAIRSEQSLRAQRALHPWLVDLRGRKYPRIPGRLPSDAVGILIPVRR